VTEIHGQVTKQIRQFGYF